VILPGRSLITIVKSNGLRMLPWGVPVSSCLGIDSVEHIRTFQDEKEEMNLSIRPFMPKFINFTRITSLCTTSYAFSIR